MTQSEQLRASLVAQQEHKKARVDKLEADLDSLTRARRSESDDDEHDPEGVTLSSQWSMLAGLLESAREDARQAADAMRRFDDGEYGICVACRRRIPSGQLEARPFRERCVPCTD